MTDTVADALQARICPDLHVLATAIQCDCGAEVLDLAEVQVPAGAGVAVLQALADAIDTARDEHQYGGCTAANE